MRIRSTPAAGLACAVLVWLFLSPGPVRGAGGGLYAVAEGGYFWGAGADFTDDNPAATTPTPLYGTGYRAAGEFDGAGVVGVGLGWRFHPRLRADFRVDYQTTFSFTGESNFLPEPSPEPVTGRVRSVTAMATLYVDLLGEAGVTPLRLRPFAGAGLGLARNRMESMTLRYPTLAVPHTLTTPGGSRDELAWQACAGVSLPLGRRVALDAEYRYRDFGCAGTPEGDAIRWRPTTGETRLIPIGGTHARLAAHGLFLAVRAGF